MHNHNHSHTDRHRRYDRAFKIGIALNFGFVLTQVVFGFLTNSLALLADAGHNLSDVLGLIIAWGANWLAQRQPSKRYTYGLRRASILSPLINASLLLGVTGFVLLESIQRLLAMRSVDGLTVIIVACVGILINGFTAYLFHADHKDDVNIKGAFLHMLADALVSAGVALSGFVILLTGWQWVDPAVSLVVGAIVGLGAWQLMQESLNLALDGVPENIDIRSIQDYLLSLPGVGSVHDLHIWALSSTEPALTVHFVMLAGVPQADFLSRVSHDLHEKFGIEHSTIQIETGSSFLPCSQSKCGV